MKKLFILVLMLLLVGCNTKTPTMRLETPKNLLIEDYVLSWDKVEEALTYEVVINDIAYTVQEPRLDVRQFEDGEYTARVKAIGLKLPESLYSEKFTFCFRESIRVPGHIKIVNDVLSWSLEQDAAKYVVKINGTEHETTTNVFNLNRLEANHFYEIQVKGVYRNIESKYSDIFVYHTFKDKYLTTEEVQYDKSSNHNFILLFEEVLVIESILFMEQELEFSVDGPELTIPVSEFQQIPYGKNQLIAFTNKGLVEVVFDLYDTSHPFLKTSNTITYVPDQDVILEFELFSSIIGEINGSGITAADYIVQGNQVLLRHQFVDKAFSNQDRKNLILGYYLLVNENDVVMGYIMISRN